MSTNFRSAVVDLRTEIADNRIAKQNIGNVIALVPGLILSYKVLKEVGFKGSFNPKNNWRVMGDNKLVSAIYLAGLGYALYQQGCRSFEAYKASQFPEILDAKAIITDVAGAIAELKGMTEEELAIVEKHLNKDFDESEDDSEREAELHQYLLLVGQEIKSREMLKVAAKVHHPDEEADETYGIKRVKEILADFRLMDAAGTQVDLVCLKRYTDKESVGMHLVLHANANTRWDYAHRTAGLFSAEDAADARNYFQALMCDEDMAGVEMACGGMFSEMEKGLQIYMRDQIIPLEWKRLGDDALNGRVYIERGRVPSQEV